MAVAPFVAPAPGTLYGSPTIGAGSPLGHSIPLHAYAGSFQGNMLAPAEWYFKHQRSRFQLIVHRGFGSLIATYALGPECTLPAFSIASALGYSYLDNKVQVTSDGVPISMHDNTVDRTTDGTGTVSALTWSYIQTLDAGSSFSSRFAGTPVPSLDQFFAFCKKRKAIASCEIRGYRTQADLALMITSMQTYGENKSTLWSSFNLSDLQYIRNTLGVSDCGLMYLASDQTQIANVKALGGWLMYAEIYSDFYPSNLGAIATIRNAGIEPAAWIIAYNNCSRGAVVRALVEAGLRFIIADGPYEAAW